MVETQSTMHVEEPREETTHKKSVAEPSGADIRVRAGGEAAAGAPSTTTTRGLRHRGPLFNLSTSQLYTILALTHLSLIVPLVASCTATTKFMFGKAADPVEHQHCNLLQIYASGLATSTGIAMALSELARTNFLHTYTADIVKMGLIAHFVATMALVPFFLTTISLGWIAVEMAVGLATAALPASSLLLTADDRSRIWRDLQNMPSWAVGALSFRSSTHRRRYSWLAKVYNMLTLIFCMAGLSYVMAPRWTLYHIYGYNYGASTHYLWQLIGAGALLTVLPAATMALKHKADIQRMAATPARTLNMGLMATAVGHLLALGPVLSKGSFGFMLPGLVGTWGATLVASMLGLAAPEVTELVEEVVEAAKRD